MSDETNPAYSNLRRWSCSKGLAIWRSRAKLAGAVPAFNEHPQHPQAVWLAIALRTPRSSQRAGEALRPGPHAKFICAYARNRCQDLAAQRTAGERAKP